MSARQLVLPITLIATVSISIYLFNRCRTSRKYIAHEVQSKFSRPARIASSNQKDSKLDQFIKCISENFSGLGTSCCSDILLIPRDNFLRMGRFERNDKCLSSLINLIAARATCTDLKILFVSHRWERSGITEGNKNEHYHATSRFLKIHTDITHIFVDFCCISQQQITSRGYVRPIRAGHLRSLPLAIIRADYLLLLPRREGRQIVRYTNLDEMLNRGWVQLELIIAHLAKTPIHVHFQVGEKMESYLAIDPSTPGQISSITSNAISSLLQDGIVEGTIDLTHDYARENWSLASFKDIRFIDIFKAALSDYQSITLEKAKELLRIPTFSINDAPATNSVLGSVLLEEDRPEILRLLLFSAGAWNRDFKYNHMNN